MSDSKSDAKVTDKGTTIVKVETVEVMPFGARLVSAPATPDKMTPEAATRLDKATRAAIASTGGSHERMQAGTKVMLRTAFKDLLDEYYEAIGYVPPRVRNAKR